MSHIINFYSGPAILPESVKQQAIQAIESFENTGLSILEISHRAKEFVAVMDRAQALAKELMNLPENYAVLFLQGGASSQFHSVPYNLLDENKTAAYFDIGTWSKSAIGQAKLFGNVQVAASSADDNYNHIPKQFDIPNDAAYLHITTNETIAGSQFHFDKNPKVFFGIDCPLVADMSSDILSREMDFSAFDLIYAGAQKNIGIAGATMVAVNKNILGKVNRPIPDIIDYQKQIANGSMKNTPSVFAVYVSYLTLQWIKAQGLKNLETQNIRKANKLYNAIDASALFKGTVAKEDRSLMNVCFVMNEKTLESEFSKFAKDNDIAGLDGHRSVGGFRASIYNAMPESGVDALIQLMQEFERTH